MRKGKDNVNKHYENTYIVNKHYENTNILKISPPKTENLQIKILIFFIFLLKNIDCGYSLKPHRRGGSNEYTNLNKTNNVYPVNHSFTI